ncbi:MAG: hypothetical protein N3A58_02845 [Spirochaetes bacterium]|nr:hypothetical protein [Spirochaetota bacterium]
MKYKFFGIQNFNIKKFSGIFLYSYYNKKIKFLAAYNLLFISKDKEFSYNLKKLISFGITHPISFIFSEKRNLYNTIFFNKKLRKLLFNEFKEEKYFLFIKTIYKDFFEANLERRNFITRNGNILKDPMYSLYRKVLIDYDGYKILNKILYFYERETYKLFFYCSSIKKSKIVINGNILKFNFFELFLKRLELFIQDISSKNEKINRDSISINFEVLNNNKNLIYEYFIDIFKNLIDLNLSCNCSNLEYKIKTIFNQKKVLFIEGFPYWEIEKWIYFFNSNNNFNNWLLKNMSVNSNLSFQYLKNYIFYEKEIPEFLELYIKFIEIYKLIIHIFKIFGFKIFLDDSYTSFRISPILEYFNYNKEYDNIDLIINKYNKDGENLYINKIKDNIIESKEKRPDLYDFYLFGSNLVNGLNFNIILFNDNVRTETYKIDNSCKDKEINNFGFREDNVFCNKFMLKLFKIFYLKILNKDYYKNYYFYLNLIYRKIKKINKYNLIGPYKNIYNNLPNSDNLINKKYKTKKEKIEKKFYFSFYNYGVLPLKMRDQDFRAIISIL